MSNASTVKMIRAYVQRAPAMMFLSGMFLSPPENFHSSEEVEIDIMRTDEEVAIVLTDLGTGYRMNAGNIYTNKKFKPPIYKEAVTVRSDELIKRQPGDTPFQDPDFRSNLTAQVLRDTFTVVQKIRRSIELQASQILQTGVVTLTDETGVALYTLDYSPKATHFPTAGTAWNAASADPLGDLDSLAEVIRNDGLGDPDELYFGKDAWNVFIADATVQAHFDNRRIDQGLLSGLTPRGRGSNYRGQVIIGNNKYDCFTYGARYNHPVTGVKTQFIAPGNVIMRDSSGRLDATFGAIPNIGKILGVTGANLLPELPSRIASEEGSLDLFTNAWISTNGEEFFAGVGARPLLIPSAIDTYGCLITGI